MSDEKKQPKGTPQENEPPDESTLLGATGVEAEVLAELARAEAELSAPDVEPEEQQREDDAARGAEV